ncbi:2'-5'-oligoadenylate synthase 2 [Sminthopsis crassicaudata]|uniref:2'-5'-oligoadenylate synthase 2 n=1 Tax=Sminthopsis crassicaudata TaxID=9301 RepID=UPI003D685E1E
MLKFFLSWFSDLYSELAENLDQYIQNKLQPSKKQLQKIDENINTICEFLELQSQVKGILLGGSYGRNTVLKGHSDGTIVIFFSEPFAEAYIKQTFIKDFIKIFELTRAMGKFNIGNEKFQLELIESELTITFDIHPVFSTLVEPSGWQTSRDKPSIDTYQKWINPGKSAFESPFCFTQLQRRFFSNLPRKLKDLILLVKHWYQEKLKQDSLPLQYALELLTVYAWEQGSGKDDFNIAEGILTVLELITKYNELCIYWTVNYDFEDETIRNYLQSQLQKDRPIILDPADPTRNVAESAPKLWKQLAKEAKNWSTLPSFKEENSSFWKPWDILPASLYVTRGHMLDKFIHDFLQPKQESLEQINKAVNIIQAIFNFLTEKYFKDSTITVKNIVKVGSTAKGIALRRISDPEWSLYPRDSDVDLVIFFNCFQNHNDQNASRAMIIKEIQKYLLYRPLKDFEIKFEVTKWKNPRVLSFNLKSKLLNRCQEFDLLPAFDALDPQVSKSKPDPEIYIHLIKTFKCNSGSEFSTCFIELQRDFIRPRTTKLKSLIRLMKYWYKQCHRKLKKKGSLPPKYAVELLTVYAWEQGSGMHDFDTAEGFLTVLKLIMQYKELCIYWTVNYDFQNEIIRDFLLSQLSNSRPVILDPADPTGDVGGGDRWCWHLLAHEAEMWLSSLCFKRGDFNPVKSWQVPTVQTTRSSGLGRSL